LELVSTKVSYVVQEATVVSRDILRKYPGQYESIISTLCENLDSLDEPESKKSIIWVIGQYAARIENADTLLEDFVFSLADETYEVQLALLTATVKLFIARPAKGQELVLRVLSWATKEADNPDIRDRGFMYWRLLSTNLNATRQIVLSEKKIGLESENRFAMEEYIGSLASVYHKSPQQFIRGNHKPRVLEQSPALRLNLGTSSVEVERYYLLLVSSADLAYSYQTGNAQREDHGNPLSPTSPQGDVFGYRAPDEFVGARPLNGTGGEF